jgi:hypothetical protein
LTQGGRSPAGLITPAFASSTLAPARLFLTRRIGAYKIQKTEAR